MIFNHIKKLKSEGKRIGITFSTFDLLHAGHILMLKEARGLCDKLIVGLQTDPTIDRPDTKNKPIQSVVERYIQLQAVKYVDDPHLPVGTPLPISMILSPVAYSSRDSSVGLRSKLSPLRNDFHSALRSAFLR
jgi:glycerol-3-phosphate cytidylyltransferase